MASRWTEFEEQHLLSLIDQTYLEGRNTQYPMLNFEEIAAMMNRDSQENLRVYNASLIELHYRVYLRRNYPSGAALAAGQLANAQAASRIVEVAMTRSVEADRWVTEVAEKVGQAGRLLDPTGSDLGPWSPLEDAKAAARAAREVFRVAAENAERAINRAKRSVEDACALDTWRIVEIGPSAT